jgi:hypothetical protein
VCKPILETHEVVRISALAVFPNHSVDDIPVESHAFFEFLGNLFVQFFL